MELLALVESVGHVSVRYRLAALAPALAERGVRLALEALPKSLLGRLRLYRRAADFGGVVLQRTLLPRAELAALRRTAKCLVFDYDDAVWMRDSYHPRGPASRKRARRFARTVGAADVILAGNGFLAENARHTPATVAVVPTVVDSGAYPAAVHTRRGGDCLLTWVGTSSTLQGLALASEHFRAAAARLPGLTLRVVCNRPAELPIRTEFVPWDAATEARDLSRCDIGVSWVPDDGWSRGKCGLKLVQYLAAGLPAVTNPVGVHGEIVPPGWGTLATTPSEWADAVGRLALDPSLRQQLGDLGRARVRDSYSLAAAASIWAATLAKVGGPACVTSSR